MKKSRMTGRIVVVLVMAMALTLLATPAWAAGVVPNHATLVGPTGKSVDLYGMDKATALAQISLVASVAPMPNKIILKANGKTYVPTLVATSIWLDKEATFAKASAPASGGVTTFSFAPAYAVNSARLDAWVTNLGKLAYSKPVDAYRKVVKGKLVIISPRNGYAVDRTKTRLLIAGALAKAASHGKIDAGPVYCPMIAFKSKVAPWMFNKVKTIVVSLSKRTVTLYTGLHADVTYRCAVGQAAYPTPPGIWKVVSKVKRPSWHNPGSGWARNMPSYIGPGPGNPLGLAALYLSASGIRIHGTKNIASIGTPASHGCIRLANSNILKLYPLVPVGTAVYIAR